MLVLSAVVCGCKGVEGKVGLKREAVSYSEEILDVKQPLQLDLAGDLCNIEVYSWDRDQVKFEIIKRIRGIEEAEALQRRLKDFYVAVAQEGNKVVFKSEYKGAIKNPADRRMDLKVFVPRGGVDSVDIKLETGRIKFHDDIKSRLNAQVKMASTEINRFEGVINFNADMGDLRIAGGKIYNGSDISINTGNIQIKAEFENGGIYCFQTKMGNIDLSLPDGSPVSFENVGATEVNDFTSGDYKTKVKLLSGLGKISVRKY